MENLSCLAWRLLRDYGLPSVEQQALRLDGGSAFMGFACGGITIYSSGWAGLCFCSLLVFLSSVSISPVYLPSFLLLIESPACDTSISCFTLNDNYIGRVFV